MVFRSGHRNVEEQSAFAKEADRRGKHGPERWGGREVLAGLRPLRSDFSKIYDRKIALVQEYLDNYQTMSGDDAQSYLLRRAAVEDDAMELRREYLPEFRKVLTGRETALFFQIDWRLDLMINVQLAQAPVINP